MEAIHSTDSVWYFSKCIWELRNHIHVASAFKTDNGIVRHIITVLSRTSGLWIDSKQHVWSKHENVAMSSWELIRHEDV